MPHGTTVSRLLVVVARTDSKRYEWFKSVFGDDATVEVIFDRRQGERRQRDVPVQAERRRGERRVQAISYELRRLGYALVRRSAPTREMVKRILVVDDEQMVLDMLSEHLATLGYTVETAFSGTEALAAVRRWRPDLVLLDVRMPGMDGVAVLRRLRETAPESPVVMVTANVDLAVARETLSVGAFDYIPKPFDFDHLDRVVEAAISHAPRPSTSAP